jgi:hypothetical protein
MSVIPWVPILVATLVAFFLGALWYSPVAFGRVWMRESGLGEEGCSGRPKALILGGTFVLTLISTSVLSFCLGPQPGTFYGVIAGLVVGLGWVATSIGTSYLFEKKSFKLFAITAGYYVVRFALSGFILGLLQ